MKPTEVWDVLMELAGATEYRRADFVHHAGTHKPGELEYRFKGALGFGGKVWSTYDGLWRVTCYSEDETSERLAMIDATNARLGGRP